MTRLAHLVVALGLACATSAAAQTLKAEGEGGVAISDDGRSRLHIGADAGLGFDTNPYSVTEATDTGDFGGDFVFRVRPYLEVNAPGALLGFKGRAALDYGFFPGLINPQTKEFLLYQTNVSGDLEVNRGGMFSFGVGDTVSWNSDPGIAVIGTLLNRVHNQLRAGVGMTPGGGTLNLRLAYTFDFTKYLDIEGNRGIVADGVLDSMRHGLTLRSDYRFLPKTGVFASVAAGWQSYPFTNTQNNAFPISIHVGLQGNVLPKLAGLVSVGYSNPLVVDDSGLVTGGVIGVVGQAEVQWAPSPQTSVAGGFQRKFDPIALYQFITNNRFYGRVQQNLLGRFALTLGAGYSVLEFGAEDAGGIQLTDRATGRLDGNLDVGVNASYYFFDWLSVGINNELDWRVTNAVDATNGKGLGYIRNQTLAVVNVRY